MAWMQLLAVAFAAGLAWWMGGRIGRTRGWWAIAFACGLVLLANFIGHRSVRLWFVVSWLADARISPSLVALASSLLFRLLLEHIPIKQTRQLAGAMGIAAVLYTCVWPLSLSIKARHSLANIHTFFNNYGVCLQSRMYTCGPASAVTCLSVLGVKADEGTLAIESLCRPQIGIQPELLAAAITRMHRDDGVVADYRWVESLDRLPLPSIACMTTGGGHDVAVLYVEKDHVTVGDPARGLIRMTRLNFMRAWTGAAIVLETTGQQQGVP